MPKLLRFGTQTLDQVSTNGNAATSDLDVGMSENINQMIRWRVPLFLNCPTAELANSLLFKLYFPYFRCMNVTRKTFDNVQPIYSQLKYIKTS